MGSPPNKTCVTVYTPSPRVTPADSDHTVRDGESRRPGSPGLRNLADARLPTGEAAGKYSYRQSHATAARYGHNSMFSQPFYWWDTSLSLIATTSIARSAFKIVAARLAARGAFKIVACFLHNGNSKVCLWKIFASFDFPCLKNKQLLGFSNP